MSVGVMSRFLFFVFLSCREADRFSVYSKFRVNMFMLVLNMGDYGDYGGHFSSAIVIKN